MNKQDKEDYSKIDHVHCWEEKKPPCGQRIEHLLCCLCEKVNPKVQRTLEEIREATEKLKTKPRQTGMLDSQVPTHNSAIDKALSIIDKHLK